MSTTSLRQQVNSFTMSGMKMRSQVGAANLLLPFILATLLFLGAAAFGVWAFGSRQDYKNNVDQKISVAVTVAKQQESTEKDKQFAEAEKQPLKSYTGPEAYGSLTISFPKTWSAYIDASGNGDAAVDGYFHPGVVPALTGDNQAFALRAQVLAQSYSEVLGDLQDLQEAGQVTITAYSAPKVSKVIGIRAEGQIAENKKGSMIVLPLRDKTLKIWTEAAQYQSDFNNFILPNFSFAP